MQSSFYWKNWPEWQRRTWYFLAVILALSICYMWFNYFQGANGIIGWEKMQEQKPIETTVHEFRLGPFHLSIPAENYVVFEYLAGGELRHNLTASYIFLAILALSIVFLLAIATTLARFWYFVAMSIFIIVMVSLRFEVLALFGEGMTVSLAVLVVYALVSFYYKYIRTHASFNERMLTFFAMTAGLAFLVAVFSEADYPFLHLVATAYTPALILTLLFVITVAHEIMVSFVYIASEATRDGSAKHFSIISFIYLVNVIITCLHEMGVIEWNFIYINVYLLLSISAMLGIWGFRIREPQYDRIFLFEPFGAFFYVCFASIAFITIAQLLGNANDATLKVVRDIIIFSHAGFGIVFFIYFFSNFLAIMADGNRVYNILYKPNRMPYFTFRLAGLIATCAFLFSANWREYVYHGTAGFYNYIADLYMLQDDETYGRAFYEQSSSRAFQNHRANYALGFLKTDHLDFDKAKSNYEMANGKRPTEFSLANEGNLHFWTGRYFDAIQAFQKGRRKKPDSGVLSNNLGYAFVKVHGVDSASHYLSQARDQKVTRSSAEINFFGMAAAEYIPIDADSVLKTFETDSRAVAANALAVSTLLRQKFETTHDPLSERELDLYEATYLNNYIVANARTVDTTWIRKAHALIADSVNLSYREALLSNLAHAYYHRGHVQKAFQILGELTYVTQNYQGKFNYILGLWSLEQGDPRTAADYFNYAAVANYKYGKFYRAIALLESARRDEALVAWDSLTHSNDLAIRDLAAQILRLMTVNAADAASLPDPEKYQFCRYRIGLKDSVLFTRLVQTFDEANYKAQALLDFSKKLFKAGKVPAAIRIFSQISGMQLTDKRLFDDVRHFELIMLASRGELHQLADQINKGIEFDDRHVHPRLLYAALIAEARGDTAAAARNFELLASSNPFFEEGVIAAARFFRGQDPKSIKPYTILTDAIYLNKRSVKLLRAYAEEALRQGFDEYALSAIQTLNEVLQKQND